eukprot:1344177-Pleurochrysis_carterae.AAC.1
MAPRWTPRQQRIARPRNEARAPTSSAHDRLRGGGIAPWDWEGGESGVKRGQKGRAERIVQVAVRERQGGLEAA